MLASWAVPKGPSLDPAARQLAVHVEDHPLEYADFEGVIPRGEYGGGDVIVWDRGTWTPAHTDDPAAAIAAGELHFDLTGEKLAGRFALDPARRAAAGGKSGCSSTRTTSTPGTAGPPTTIPTRCSAAARTTRSPPLRTPVAERRAGRGGRGPAGCGLVGAADRRRAGRPRRDPPQRPVVGRGPRRQADQPRQGALPGAGRRAPGHQARTGAALRDGRRPCCCPTSPGGR